ncbi:hypothetical protein K491DRAFT_451026 [Lophiostoma macrostomum CBS 122681]|uniref:Uncharacterized protein n=1 Tax=Lophiostoma macrostomum CBS 122681 TaxID=1314788 RepID=A0A6A6TPI8_9PLEO|nr:hypothetical protein K491DRAFT_451026 [Lophiostoma macrostomum CBS 122681]
MDGGSALKEGAMGGFGESEGGKEGREGVVGRSRECDDESRWVFLVVERDDGPSSQAEAISCLCGRPRPQTILDDPAYVTPGWRTLGEGVEWSESWRSSSKQASSTMGAGLRLAQAATTRYSCSRGTDARCAQPAAEASFETKALRLTGDEMKQASRLAVHQGTLRVSTRT